MKYRWFFVIVNLLVAGNGIAHLPLGKTFKLIANNEVVVLDKREGHYYFDIYEPEKNAYDKSFDVGDNYLDITSGDLNATGYDEFIGLYKTDSMDGIYIVYKDTSMGTWNSMDYSTDKPGQLYITCGDVVPDSINSGLEIITASRDSIFVWGGWDGSKGLSLIYSHGKSCKEKTCVVIECPLPEYSSLKEKEQFSDIACGDINGDGIDEIIYAPWGVSACCGNIEGDVKAELIILQDGGLFSNDRIHIYEWNEDSSAFTLIRTILTEYKGLIDIVSGNIDTDIYDEIIVLDNGKWARIYNARGYEGSFELIANQSPKRITSGDCDGDNTQIIFVGGPYLCSSELWPSLVISLPPYQDGIVTGMCELLYGEAYQEAHNLDATFSVTAQTTIGYGHRFPGGLFEAGVSASIEAGLKKHIGESKVFTWGSWYKISSAVGKNVVIATRTYYNGFLYKIIDPKNGLGDGLDKDTVIVGVPVASSNVLPMYLDDYLTYANTIDYLPKDLLLPAQQPGNITTYPQGYVYSNGYQIPQENLLFAQHSIYNVVPEGIDGGWVLKLENAQLNENTLFSNANLALKLNVAGMCNFQVAGAVGTNYTHSIRVGRKLEIRADMGYIPDSLDYWRWFYEYSPYIYHTSSDQGGFYVLNFMVQNLGDGYGIEEKNVDNVGEPIAEISPNPSRCKAEISYRVNGTHYVRINIYDQAGRLVANLVDETKEPGIYKTMWSPKDIRKGIYFCRFELGDDYKATRKIVLIN